MQSLLKVESKYLSKILFEPFHFNHIYHLFYEKLILLSFSSYILLKSPFKMEFMLVLSCQNAFIELYALFIIYIYNNLYM